MTRKHSEPVKVKFIDGGDVYAWRTTDDIEEYVTIITRDKSQQPEEDHGLTYVRLSREEVIRLARELVSLVEPE